MSLREVTEAETKEALDTLRRGGVVVFPTETAYGIAADATNTRAVERVLAIKGREEGKTVALIVADLTMAERYLEFSDRLHELAREFWPGPLTIVAKAKPGTDLSPAVIRENGTIAIRVSSHPVATRLSRDLLVPIVATSANHAGESTCFSVPAVRQQLDAQPLQPDLYLDGGVLPRKKPSTIVKASGRKIVILREGSLTLSRRHLA